jgi:hypothetical protein
MVQGRGKLEEACDSWIRFAEQCKDPWKQNDALQEPPYLDLVEKGVHQWSLAYLLGL